MTGQEITTYSASLGRDMTHKAFGHAGRVCLAFPPQGGTYRDFEGFGMVDTVAPWIEAGKLRLVLVDGIDNETWCAQAPEHDRIALHERWFAYVTDELVPLYAAPGERVMATGCSMGGLHAGNFMCRRPDVFGSCICLSGIYRADFFFPGYTDPLVFANSPQDFMPGLAPDHPHFKLLQQSDMVFCVGQGAWEDDLLASTREMDRIFAEKGLGAWFDYWGYDVNHDWPWWRKQLPYFMQHLVPLD
jgi:esterase/lipase superfamily enzyme